MTRNLVRLSLLAAAAAATLAAAPAAFAHGERQYVGTFVPEGGGGRTGSGTLFMEFDPDMNTLLIQATWEGLSGVTTVAHIHCCTVAAGTGNAGVALAGGAGNSLISFPVGVSAGSYSQVFDLSLSSVYGATFLAANGGTAAGAAAAMLAAFDTQRAYLNIHSNTFTGGEIRAVVQVPEPGTWGMMALGLAGVGLLAQRRQRAR